MSQTGQKKAFAGSIASRVFTATLQFIFAPLFIRYLGREGYGVIGFYYALSTASNILDFGISATINREIAKRRADIDKLNEIPSLLYSLELVYWGISAAVVAILLLSAPYLAGQYLHRQYIDEATLRVGMYVVAVAIGVQFPISFYQGVFLGYERQGTVNLITILFGLPRILGSAILVVAFSRSVIVFLTFQAVVSLAQTLLYAVLAWSTTGNSRRAAVFRRDLLMDCRRFLAGAGIVSLLFSTLNQIDKLLVPKLLTLAEGGLYTLVSAPTVAITMVTLAASQTFFPRLARLVAAKDSKAVDRHFHLAAHAVAVTGGTAAIVLICLAHTILWMWTGDIHLADRLSLPLQLLSGSSLLWCLLELPWALSMANNAMTTGIVINLVKCAVVIPLIVVLTKANGLIGPPQAWMIVNATALVFGSVLMLRTILEKGSAKWAFEDTILPLLAMGVVGFVTSRILNSFESMSRLIALIETFSFAIPVAIVGLLAGPCRGHTLALVRRRLGPIFKH